MKGYALLIGVDEVSTSNYGDPFKMDCIKNNITELEKLLKRENLFKDRITPLRGANCTWENVQKQLENFSNLSVTEEGYLLIYYSGHGISYPFSEPLQEKKSEFFFFYDRMVYETEIRESLSSINSKIKVFLIADSCHSGGLNTLLSKAIMPIKLMTYNFEISQETKFEAAYSLKENLYNNLISSYD